MALVSFEQAQALQQELADTRAALRAAVDEQDRLVLRNAELAEQLAVVEAERDRALRTLRLRYHEHAEAERALRQFERKGP